MTRKHIFMHTAPGQTLVISLLILEVVVVTFVVVGISSLIGAMKSDTALNDRAQSSAATTGCLEQALDRLALDANYAGNETLTVASSTCSILPVISGSGSWTLKAWSRVGDSYTRSQVQLSSISPITVTSWTDVASF